MDGLPAADEAGASTRRRVVALALAVGTVALLLHVPVLDQPLDRDMGAHATVGAALLEGRVPYVDVVDNKQPLTYVVYAAIGAVAPTSAMAVRLAAAMLAALVGVVMTALAIRVVGPVRGTAAGLLATAVGATRVVEGADLNTEHLVLAFGTPAVLAALAGLGRRTWTAPLTCGVLVGAAALTKAPGILFVVPVAVALLTRPERDGRAGAILLVLGCGIGLVVLPVVAAYAAIGHVGDLWFWNVTYNLRYAADIDLPWWRALVPYGRALQVGLVAGAALVVLVVRLLRGRRDRVTVTVAAWLLATWIGAEIGQRDFPHYFAPVVPAAAFGVVLAGWHAASTPVRPPHRTMPSGRMLGPALAGVLLLPFLWLQAGDLSASGPELAARQYGAGQVQPWLQHDAVGRWLQDHADPGDELHVIGNEPGFYQASGLLPASRHVVVFAAAVLPRVDLEVAADLANDPPRWVVQPYGGLIWPGGAGVLADDGYIEVARFEDVLVLERPPAGG